MAEGAQGGDFKLVLDAVDEARREDVVAELAEVLFLDRRTAGEAVRNAPIVLIAGMNQEQAANVRTHVLRLAKLGAKLRLTSEPVGRLKQLRWQALPPVVRRPANIFVCPSCGERFVVQRWAAPEPAPPKQAEPEAPAPQPAAEAEAPQEAAPAEAVPVAEAVEEVPEAEPVAEAQPVAEAEPVATEEGGAELAALQAAAAESEQEAPQVEEKEPARPSQAPAAAEPSAPSGPRYDVSVAKIRGEKAERLVELLVEREGISYEEARSRCERTVVVVCRNAPSSEADEWRRALLKIGIKPRIRKRSG